MSLPNSRSKSTNKPTIWLCRFMTRSPFCKALAPEILMASPLFETSNGLAIYYYRVDKIPAKKWKLPTIQGVEVMRVEFAKAGVHYEKASQWDVTPLDRAAVEIGTLVKATVAVGEVVLKLAHDHEGIAQGVFE